MNSIKAVIPADLADLLELIRELASFERLEHELQATPESLQEAFFDTPPSAGALLAREDGLAVGYAIYFFTFSSFVGRRGIWLEDVYVRPPFRHRGLGRRLIQEVARIGVQHNCGRYEWTALNWNTVALDVYRKMGAQPMSEWIIFRLNDRGLRGVAEGTGEFDNRG